MVHQRNGSNSRCRGLQAGRSSACDVGVVLKAGDMSGVAKQYSMHSTEAVQVQDGKDGHRGTLRIDVGLARLQGNGNGITYQP